MRTYEEIQRMYSDWYQELIAASFKRNIHSSITTLKSSIYDWAKTVKLPIPDLEVMIERYSTESSNHQQYAEFFKELIAERRTELIRMWKE